MDFKTVLKKLLTAFDEQGIRYALMGGFAIGLWGGFRSTVDLDFLVMKDDMVRVHNIMTGFGYELRYHSENVSQYTSPLKVFGEVDFIHAFRQASLQMLQRAEVKEVFGRQMKVKTLIPEDIIGLKLQAIANNPERERLDMADIEMLIGLHRGRLDDELLKSYFSLFNMQKVYERMIK